VEILNVPGVTKRTGTWTILSRLLLTITGPKVVTTKERKPKMSTTEDSGQGERLTSGARQIPYVKDDLDLKYTGEELTKPLKVRGLKTLVVGTGRCGTVYLAKLLSSAGRPCGHESIFRVDGWDAALRRMKGQEEVGVSLISQLASIRDEASGRSWFNGLDYVEADASYMAVPFLDHDELADVQIVHAVRNPIQVINSFVVGFKYFRDDWKDNPRHRPYHEFIYTYLGGIDGDKDLDPVSRAAFYVVGWNEMIDHSCGKSPNYFRFNVESSGKLLLSRLGLNTDVQTYSTRDCNHRINMPNFVTSAADIPNKEAAGMIESLSEKYGYRRVRLL
jgi:hypothetical protein